MKKNRIILGVFCFLVIVSLVGLAWAEVKTVTTTILDRTGKKSIIFKNDEGKEINAEVSSGRSAITIAGKRGSLKDLKPGMKIKITYNEDGGPNEPTAIEVLE